MKETVNTKMENLQWEIMYGKMFLRPEVLANKTEEADRLRYIESYGQSFVLYQWIRNQNVWRMSGMDFQRAHIEK